MDFFWVGLGAVLGALSRYGVYLGVRAAFGRALPAATLAVNVVGCLAIGAFMAWSREQPGLSPHLRLLLVVGFLGSFTTYSAFGLETLEYLRAGQTARAFALVAAHLTLGLGAVWLGLKAFG
jgi:CrcB protein